MWMGCGDRPEVLIEIVPSCFDVYSVLMYGSAASARRLGYSFQMMW